MARYIKRTVSANFKDHRPAMVPEIPAAIKAAEIRHRLAQIRTEAREELTWDRVGGDE